MKCRCMELGRPMVSGKEVGAVGFVVAVVRGSWVA